MIELTARNRLLSVAYRYRIIIVVLLQLSLVSTSFLASAALLLGLDGFGASTGPLLTILVLLVGVRTVTLAVFRLQVALGRPIRHLQPSPDKTTPWQAISTTATGPFILD